MDDKDALKTLKLRYTKGELTRKEYLQMKEDIEGGKNEEEEESKASHTKPTKAATSPTKNNSGKFLVVGLIVVLLLFVFFRVLSNTNGGSSNTGAAILPITHTVIMYQQGDAFALSPKQYEESAFTVPSSATSVTLTGTYTSGGYVEAAVMTAQQYAAFSGATLKTDVLESAYAYYGDTESGSMNTELQSGVTYYVVFYDPGVVTSITVNIGNPVQIQYTD